VEPRSVTGGSAVIPALDEMVQSRTQINTLVANLREHGDLAAW